MKQQQLLRIMGGGFATAVTVGSAIGLGIMRSPGEIAATINDPWLYMAVWAGGGIFIFLSLMVVLELISMTQQSGGIYVLVNRAFGAFPAFVIGWSDWLGNCASKALQIVVMLEYSTFLFPELQPYKLSVAIAVTSFFALIQLAGSRFTGTLTQLTSLGSMLIIIVVTAALVYGGLSHQSSSITDIVAEPIHGLTGYAIVIAAVIFTYDGWIAISGYSGEMKDGAQSIVRGAIRGTLLIIGLYLLVNAAVVMAVPFSSLQGHELALAGALDTLYGEGAGTYLFIGAILILLAHQNLGYMWSSRVLYALSIRGFGIKEAGRVTTKGTPATAVLVTWAMIVLLITLGGFNLLLSLVSLLFVVGYVAVLAGVMRLRGTEPETNRPFKSWGYPVLPITITSIWVAVAVFIAVVESKSSLYGAILISLAFPVYFWMRSRLPDNVSDAAVSSEVI